MSLSERKKRELRALAQGAGEALVALEVHSRSKQEARPSGLKLMPTKKGKIRN